MWRPDLLIRPDERRDATAAFLVLFGFVASHTLLETARDALFLAKVPASRLPWMFLTIAALSVVVATAQQRFAGKLGGRVALAVWTAVAAVVTFASWLLVPALGAGGVYALYVWSGVLTILVLVHFWTLLGTIFSITQAKRLYGVIGAGSVLGALVGSGAASLLARTVAPRTLVLFASAGFLATAFLPLRFTPQVAPAPLASSDRSSVLDGARFVVRHPYARRVALLLFAATMSVTLADYLFKSAVAAEVPEAELGTFLGTVSFALNLASLIVQIAAVNAVVRRVGVSAALALLPLLLVVSGASVMLLGTLGAALAMKAVDGSLRYSLHRTASELVFLPLGEEARRRTRSFVDVVGQRGGQAVASVAILLLAALGAPVAALAAALVVLAALWAWLALSLRRPYLDLFRSRLRGRRITRDDDELHLDVASLETLVRALGSENDNEVLAALDVLDREGKPDLVPVLILYHPSDAVVERALEMFTRAKRRAVVPIIDRLGNHPSPRVRGALLTARSVLDEDLGPLLERLGVEDSAEVRASIEVSLIASGARHGVDAHARLEAIVEGGASATKIALAEAIARHAAEGFSEVLVALARASDPNVRLAAVRAIGRVKPPEALPLLIEALREERLRPDAQRILVELGKDGFDALVRAIDDTSLSLICRVRIPQTLAQLDAEPASAVLLQWLTREKEGAVRYQILRALDRLTRRVPALVLDRALLDRTIDATVRLAYRHLDRRLILERDGARVPARKTAGHEALVQLLADEQANAIQRLFDLLGLAYRSDDFRELHRGLRSGRKDARATSMELVENALREPLRTATLGLVDDVVDGERLAAAGKYHAPLDLDYEGVLAEMLASGSDSVQDLTVFHVGELGLVGLQAAVAALADPPSRSDVGRTLALLEMRRAS